LLESWRDIRVSGTRPVEKVVAVFRISDTRTESRLRFPFPLFNVKVVEALHGGFWASPNVAIKSQSGEADWIGARGDTIEGALHACLEAFMKNIGEREWL
jgi:hypothetical protein